MTDIQPGDVVVCVSTNCGSKHPLGLGLLVVGRVYRVLSVIPRHDSWPTKCPCGIIVQGVPPKNSSGTCGARFRKIRPADPEFVEMLKRVRAPVLEDMT